MRDELRRGGVIKKEPQLKTIEAVKIEHTQPQEWEREGGEDPRPATLQSVVAEP